MAIPTDKDLDLALLLELAREGGGLRPAQVLPRVARHFPDLTEADMAITRKDGRTKVFQNSVAWARNDLRVRGLLATDQPGIWKVNEGARPALVLDLVGRGAAETGARAFIDDRSRVLPDLLGARWSRPKGVRRVRSQPPVEEPPAPAEVRSLRPLELAQTGEPPSEAPRSLAVVRQAIIHRLNAMPGYEFEQIVARVLDGVGLRDSQVVGRSGDEGVDIIAYLHSPFVTAKVAVQVKRQTANVGPKDISYLRDRWASAQTACCL